MKNKAMFNWRKNRYILFLFIIIWLLGFLFQGCGIFKNLDRAMAKEFRLSDSSLRMEQTEVVQLRRVLEMQVMDRDTMQSGYRVQILPMGRFSFSPEKGFEGEAAQVSWKGNIRQTHIFSRQKLGTIDSIKQVNVQASIEGHSEAIFKTETVKRWISWKTVLGFGLVIFCLISAILFFRSLVGAMPWAH